MAKMILTRLLRGLITLAIVTVLVFILLRSVPGDMAAMLAGGDATEEQIEELREMWGLNKGLGEQFFIYIRNLLKGDTGWSYQYLENGKPLYTAMELVLMHDLFGYRSAEMAHIRGEKASTVRKKLGRAREELKKAYREEVTS